LECHALLASANSGRLGIVAAGRPEIFALRYALDVSGAIVFQTDPGTELAGALGKRVVFEVDDIGENEAGWSVVVHGVVQQTALASLQFGTQDPPKWMSPASITARITPTRVTGRILAVR
jgi:nitroimidazol reductase NimA-like FMN-containing flavoprotein (pyridoxamine 5'-phosphate oxidase superfamily)